MSELRTERLGCLIQEILGALIVEGKIKDSRVTPFVSVTRVTVSGDISYADVYISNVNEKANIARNVEGLQSAAGFINSCLNKALRIRKIPRLRFHPDTGIRDGFDLVRKIEQLTANNEGN